MGSWLQQALRWWAQADGGPIPPRHFTVMADADYIAFDGFDSEWHLTERGRRALKEAARG